MHSSISSLPCVELAIYRGRGSRNKQSASNHVLRQSVQREASVGLERWPHPAWMREDSWKQWPGSWAEVQGVRVGQARKRQRGSSGKDLGCE